MRLTSFQTSHPQPPQQQQAQQAPQLGPVTEAPWHYLDPSGTSQGPFERSELLEWHDSGYFPLDLPLRPADAPPTMPFVPLAEMLECGQGLTPHPLVAFCLRSAKTERFMWMTWRAQVYLVLDDAASTGALNGG